MNAPRPHAGATRDMHEERRYHWLDWLRFLAAFMVLVVHTRGSTWLAWDKLDARSQNPAAWVFFAVTRVGLEAVAVFFVLSGFLVGGRALERVRQGAFDAKSYALDRLSRIYIPLLPALVLTGVINHVCGGKVSLWEGLGNVFALQGLFCDSFAGNPPLWSLAYEVWFYWLAGFAALLFAPAGKRWLALSGVALGFLVFSKLDAALLFCWCLGAVSHGLSARAPGRASFFAGLVLALAGCGLSQAASSSVSVNTSAWLPFMTSRPVALLVLSLGLAVVVPFLARRPPRAPGLAALERFGTTLAAFSYTLYLTHFPVLVLWDRYLPRRYDTLGPVTFLVFLTKLAACLLVAWILYWMFESRTGRVRNWVRRRRSWSAEAPAFPLPPAPVAKPAARQGLE